LEILHFNDVYKIEENANDLEIKDTHPVVYTRGGAARFVTAMKNHGCNEKLVLFSGDLLSPSTISMFRQGMQMVEIFNTLKVRATCLGNHDIFDYGSKALRNFIHVSNEMAEREGREANKWLMANFRVTTTNDEEETLSNPLAGLEGTHIIHF
jgi:2',3'-cyclic-nucleotide 2'-phosphodiesterase (5'-nucleotidase family)